MNEDQLSQYTEKLKNNILKNETIPSLIEEKLLQEIENLQHLINGAQQEELQHYKLVLDRIDHILKFDEQKNKSQFLKSSLKEFRESVRHLEENHPKIVDAVEQIIDLFVGWGLV